MGHEGLNAAPARQAPGDRRSWLLLADEAVVMLGSQFREVALPLLLVTLWPNPKSYAVGMLALLLPRLGLARWWGAAADRWPPRTLLVISYAVRAAGAVGLAVARSLPVAWGALILLAVGHGLYVPAVSHYKADGGAPESLRLVSRLRTVASSAQAILPWVSGLLMASVGWRIGFDVSAAAYAVSLLLMASLPYRPPSREVAMGGATPAIPPTVRRHILAVGLFNGLAWMANMLYTAYLLVGLKVGAPGFGFALALWGGAGLLSAWVLTRVDRATLHAWTWALFLVMAATWTVMVWPVGFWTVALLGIPEGFATWLLFDALEARILATAPPASRGQWMAVQNAWAAGGRVIGLGTLVLIPALSRVHRGFLILALVMAVMSLLMAYTVRAEGERRPVGDAAMVAEPGD